MHAEDGRPFDRKKRLLVGMGVVLILALAASVSIFLVPDGIEEGASVGEFTTYLDNRIPALMKAYDIPGANIALLQRDGTTWSRAYGYADLENQRKMTTDTYCRVESISKSVTAWGVMKLVEQGKIELDQPVGKYIKEWQFPNSKYSWEKVTVGRLLSHNAGMPLGDIFERFSPDEKIPSLEENLTREAAPIREPGDSFLYSNTGYNLLELLVEEVTGRDFAEYMEAEVLRPLGMELSTFQWSEKLQPGVPVGYDLKGSPVPVYVYPAKASGGLFATVDDIAAFAAAGMTGSNVLNARSIQQLYTPVVKIGGLYGLAFESYGFGHFIEKLPNGMKAVSHGGQGGGCMTHFYLIPETGDGMVILTNSQRSWPFFANIFNDWAKWNGFSSVGMGRIALGNRILWGLIALIGLVSLGQVLRLGIGLASGRRRFTPLSSQARFLRSIQGSAAISLLAVLLWCVRQSYLDISALFPVASGWLGWALLLLALVMLSSSLLPAIKRTPGAAS